ncbi:amino acid permease, partial [Escherichia coli]|nr:amino acid permease [Escherichia coli]
IGVSPFTLVFKHAGLAFAAGLMNAVILTAVLSAGNSGMYASTRMLYNLATEGRAPRVFAQLTRNGVPRNALFATTAVAGDLHMKFGQQRTGVAEYRIIAGFCLITYRLRNMVCVENKHWTIRQFAHRHSRDSLK